MNAEIMAGGEKKRALGRGLSALLPQAAQANAQGRERSGVLALPIESIHRDAEQPRRTFDESKLHELADSIKAQGILQPVLVRREGDRYRLIAGERRWRAAQLAGLHEIPALVREASDAQAFELALVENLQRTDLNPIEEAEGFRRLVQEFGLTQEQVSERVGKDRSTITNALRLLGLPDDVKGAVADGALSMGHARALLGLPNASEMSRAAKAVSEQHLSVRQTEQLVRKTREPEAKPPATKPAHSAQHRSIVEELQRKLGTKVRLTDRGGKGTLEIDFFSYEDLDRLLTHLRK